MSSLNIYKSPITDLNKALEWDLGGNTKGEVTLQGRGARERKRKGGIIIACEWRRCKGAEKGAKTVGGGEVVTFPGAPRRNRRR